MPYYAKKGRVGKQIKPFIILFFLLVLASSVNAALSDDTIAYWAFEDDLTDDANSYDATCATCPAYDAGGIIGKALDFEADDSEETSVTDAAVWSFTDGAGSDDPFSVSYWVKQETLTDYQAPFAKYYDSNWEYYVLHDSEGKIYFSMNKKTVNTDYIGRTTADAALTTGTFYHVVVTYDGSETSAGVNIYVDGSDADTTNFAAGTYTGMGDGNSPLRMGNRDGQLHFDGLLDEMVFFDVELTPAQVTTLYNGGSGLAYPFIVTANLNPDLRISAYDLYDNSSVLTFNVTMNNGSIYETTNGTAYIRNVTIGNYTFNATYNDYFDVTNNFIIEAAQNDTTYSENVYPYASVINFSAYQVIINNSISGVTFYVNGTTQANPFNLPAQGNYVLTAEKAGYYNKTKVFNVTALDNLTINIYDMFDASVLISPRDILNNNTISNANITLSNTTYSYSSTFNAVQNATFNVTTGTYLLTITQDNHSSYNANITITNTGTSVYYAYMYAYNSLWVYAYNQDTSSSIIIFNVTIQNDNYSYNDVCAGGVARINDIVSGEYEVTVTATGYSSSTYVVTMTDNSHQNLNAYLSAATDTFIFTVKDKTTNDLIEGATITQRRFINGTLTTIESKSTDITSRVQFTYVNGIEYTFIASDDGYTTKTFNLEILFSEYTLFLYPETTGNTTVFYDDVYFAITNYKMLNNYTDWVKVNFVSNSGTLQDYFVNVTLPNGTTYSVSGSNSGGGYLNNSFAVTGIVFGQSALITYGYKSTLNTGYKILTRVYAFQTWDTQAGTSGNLRDATDDMSDLEQVFWATLISIIVVGIIGFVGLISGQPFIFSAIGVIVSFGVFLSIGWITGAAFGLVTFIMIIMIIGKLMLQ